MPKIAIYEIEGRGYADDCYDADDALSKNPVGDWVEVTDEEYSLLQKYFFESNNRYNERQYVLVKFHGSTVKSIIVDAKNWILEQHKKAEARKQEELKRKTQYELKKEEQKRKREEKQLEKLAQKYGKNLT